jgi:hypothetical protein
LPFRSIAVDHESVDPLCLSRTHNTDPDREPLDEFFLVTIAAIDSDILQLAFFNARQVAELGLKALISLTNQPGDPSPIGHDLERLLKTLHDRGDDLFGIGAV